MCYHIHPIPFSIFHWVEARLRSRPHSRGGAVTKAWTPGGGGHGGNTVKSVHLEDLVESCHEKERKSKAWCLAYRERTHIYQLLFSVVHGFRTT